MYLRWAITDAVFRDNSRHSAGWNASYSIFLYPLPCGLVLLLPLFGIRWSGSLAERPRQFLFSWLASSVAVSTNPLYAGVKDQYLVHLLLALFAAFGVLIFVNAPLTFLKDRPKTAAEGDIYVSQAEIEAARFLDSQPEGSVLCSFRSAEPEPRSTRGAITMMIERIPTRQSAGGRRSSQPGGRRGFCRGGRPRVARHRPTRIARRGRRGASVCPSYAPLRVSTMDMSFAPA